MNNGSASGGAEGVPAAIARGADRHPRTTLDDFVGGRDNNFTLIRFLAAAAVLVSHSYALSTGNPAIEPLRAWLGLSMGDLAVGVFFLTSGFLVSGSLLSRRSVARFAVARALRIYPAMVVSVALTVLAVGVWFSTWPLHAYLSSGQTWRYIAMNSILVTGIEYRLPGAFEHTPIRLAVNGSLWSLPYELAMYLLLVVVWFGLARLTIRPLERFPLAMAVIFVLSMCVAVSGAGVPRVDPVVWPLMALFFAGSCLFAFRQRVVLDSRIFAAALLLTGASMAVPSAFGVVYLLTMPYLVLYLAYARGGFLRNFNRAGDYSYGMYIYAYPVQQSLAATFPGIPPLSMLAASFAITLTLAAASWHWIEKRALALKARPARPGPR